MSIPVDEVMLLQRVQDDGYVASEELAQPRIGELGQRLQRACVNLTSNIDVDRSGVSRIGGHSRYTAVLSL